MKKDECIRLATQKILADKRKQDEKITKKRDKDLRETLKTLPDKKKELETEVNTIVRLLDKGHPCMMCGNQRMKKVNACHYHSVGGNDTIRFNLHNIWAGCEPCNSFKGGNLNGYDLCLIATFGNEYWEEVKFGLTREYQILKLTKPEVNEKIKIAREIVRELKQADKVYTNEERIELRDKYNKRLAMYL